VGCNIVALSGPQTSASIQAALNKHRKVKLPDGALITINQPIYIPAGRKLYSNPANKATIRRTASTGQRILVIDGPNTKIAHLKLDYNFANGWEGYVIPIAFGAEEFIGRRPQSRSGAKIYNVDFIESNGVVEHPIGGQTGDSWCVSFATDTPDPITRDVKIVGCNCSAEYHQLSANGQGASYHDVLIAHNLITGAFAAGIAMSSRTDLTEFRRINIRHNFILRTRSFGIFVGQDSESAVSLKFDLFDVVYEKNYVQHSDFRPFITSFLMRSGTSGGVIENSVIRDNISDATQSAALEPRSVSWVSNLPGTLSFTGNRSINFARSVVFGTESPPTESGNTYWDNGAAWTLDQIQQPSGI